MSKTCEVPLEHLVDYIEDILQGSRREELQRHLEAGCPRCEANLHWLRPMIEDMRGDDSAAPPAEIIAQAKAVYHTPTSDASSSQWQPIEEERPVVSQPNWVRIGGLVAVIVVILIGIYALGVLRLRPYTAVIVSIDRGSLQVQMGDVGPSLTARAGQIIYQGSRVRSAPDTVALIRFFDGSAMRIESAGEWGFPEIQGSRNAEIVRVVLHQETGRASYVPAPVVPRLYYQMRLETPGASIDLAGVATLISASDSTGRLSLLQGQATILSMGQRVVMTAGQEAIIASGQPVVVK